MNRPNMRYEIFHYVSERGQWKWSKGRALVAKENYNIMNKDFVVCRSRNIRYKLIEI